LPENCLRNASPGPGGIPEGGIWSALAFLRASRHLERRVKGPRTETMEGLVRLEVLTVIVVSAIIAVWHNGLPSSLLGLLSEVWQRPVERLVRYEVLTVLLVSAIITLWLALSASARVEAIAEEEDLGEYGSILGKVEATWRGLLETQAKRSPTRPKPGDFSVEALLHAMAVQSRASRVIGNFMILICKCDEANMRAIRSAWEAHDRPDTLRGLTLREKEEGVQLAPGKLTESAALALTWATRMLGFWLGILRVLADDGPGGDVNMPHHATEVVYAHWVEPFHNWFLRSTFRAGLRALPSRGDMLRRLAAGSVTHGGPATAEEMAALVADCRRCVETTTKVIATIQAALEEIGLHDTQKV